MMTVDMGFLWAFCRGLAETATATATSLKALDDRVAALEASLNEVGELKRSLEDDRDTVRKKMRMDYSAQMTEQEATDYKAHVHHKGGSI